MHLECMQPSAQRVLVKPVYTTRRPLGLVCGPQAVWPPACTSWLSHTGHRRLYTGSRPQRNRSHAFRRSGLDNHSDSSFTRSPVVDITAEPATTSGRDSNDDNSQQHRPNIIRRAAAAALGILQATVHWLRTHLKPWKLFDRCLFYRAVAVPFVLCAANTCK